MLVFKKKSTVDGVETFVTEFSLHDLKSPSAPIQDDFLTYGYDFYPSP